MPPSGKFRLNRAIFLDRDGVINRAIVKNGRPYAPSTFEEFELLPDVSNSIATLKSAGFLIIVVTNQPDISYGTQAQTIVEQMHNMLRAAELCDDILVCYHVDQHNCSCRKPKPGMLLTAASHWNVDLKHSFMVGDRWRDIGAGRAAGCCTFFIDNQYCEQRPDNPDYVVSSLAEASRIILSQVGSIGGYRS